MPNIIDELSQLIDPHKSDIYGVIGLSESLIEVANRPGWIWVQLSDNTSQTIQAHNRKVSPAYGMPVKLSFDGKKYEVENVDVNRYGYWLGGAAYLPKHGMQHSAMFGASGNDIVWVDQQQFLPLLPTPGGSITGTNKIFVSPYVFKNSKGQWIYAGNTGVTIPPSTTATGSIVYLLYMRDSDGSFYTKAGTAFAGAISGANGFIPHLAGGLENNNDIPLLAIRRTGLSSGSPIGWENVLDVRQFYKGYIPAATGSSGFIERVYTDATLTGAGTLASPLHVVTGTYLVSVATDTTLTGNGTPGSPLHVITGAWLVGVTTDNTLTGLGTPASPLHAVFTGTSNSGGGNFGLDLLDISSQVTGGGMTHFTFTPASSSIEVLLNGLVQRPADVVLDGDNLGFTLQFSITTGTNVLVGRTVVAYPTGTYNVQHSQAVFTIEGIISTTGTRPIRIYTPFVGSGATIEEVFIAVNTKPVASPVRVNILKNGSTILTGTVYVEILSGTNTAIRNTNLMNNTLNKDDYLMLEVVRGDATASDLSTHVRYKWTLMGV